MTVSSGFFNSVSGDRKYNAQHFNEIFDGLLSDGVYINWGNAFKVTPGTGLQVLVGSGRGWFKNTWIVNDAAIVIDITDGADPTYPRIDAIVIDINTGTQVRNNSIKRITGTAASSPDKPTLVDEPTHKQYPIAWVMVNAGATSIIANDITDCQLTGELPAIEALLEYSSHSKAEIDTRFTADENPSFTQASTLANIASGENFKVILGKIQKVFSTLVGHSSLKPTFYRHDGTFATPPTVDGTQPGYCPQLPAEQTEGEGNEAAYKYLRADGTWVAPPNTPNNNAVAQNSAQNANSNFPVLLKGTAAAENAVDSSKWDADMTYNPSTNNLSVYSVNNVRLAKRASDNAMGYYDAGGNFKTFRQPTGNAGAAQVLSGYSFANASSDAINGSMANRGAWKSSGTPSGNGNVNVAIPAGYHNGSGYVTCVGTTAYATGVTDGRNAQWTECYNAWYMPRYNQGVTDADNRANPGCANWNDGYNNGRAQGQKDKYPWNFKIRVQMSGPQQLCNLWIYQNDGQVYSEVKGQSNLDCTFWLHFHTSYAYGTTEWGGGYW